MSNNIRWKLFLDDHAYGARAPNITVENCSWRTNANLDPTVPDTSDLGDWVIATNVDSAMNAIVQNGLPTFVSFDHDLGDGKDGIALAHAIIEMDISNGELPDDFRFEVHSANPIGRKNIECLLRNYIVFKGRQEKAAL